MTDLQRRDPPVTVILPGEIDLSNATSVYKELSAVCGPGVAVVADLTSTTFCGSLGARQLLLADQHAMSLGGELRLAVVPGGAVGRVLELLGLDQVLLIFPTVAAAAVAGDDAGG